MDISFFSPLSKVAVQFLPGRDTDAIDRLNTYVTPLIFTVGAVLAASKQWLAQPLQCWVAKNYNPSEEQYIEKFCFVNGTYYIPMDKDIPTGVQEREDAKLSYYQWVPLVLSLQALLSSVPLLVWRMLSPKSGVNVKHCVRMALGVVTEYGDKRAETIGNVATYVDEMLNLQRRYVENQRRSKFSKCIRAAFCWLPFVGTKNGNYLPGFYIVFKLLSLAVGVLQLFIFNAFLSSPTKFFALEFMSSLSEEYQWQSTGLFPRVTLCDFTLYVLGNKQRHTVQCVLSVNFLLEKIFVFFWFWMLFLNIITAINICIWIERLVFDRARCIFIKSYLHAAVDYHRTNNEDACLRRFVHRYLCEDGVFVLRMIGFNVGIPITAAIINKLWIRFLKNYGRLSNDTTYVTTAKLRNRNNTAAGDNEEIALANSEV